MRVLFDQGTPVPLRRFLNSHSVKTVYEMGWSNARNGDLLRFADNELFEVFLTTDQKFEISAKSGRPPNRYCGIAYDKLASDSKHTAKIVAVLDSIAPGEFIEIDF